jgi:hypothetical protein
MPPSVPDSLQGNLIFDSGLPAAGMTVRLYNIGFAAQDTKLGESKSDAQGKYAISFSPALGTAPNLEVRVLDTAGKELAISNTQFHAQPTETLNLVVPTSVQPLAPEYQRISADMDKAIGGVTKLGQAQEDGARRDLRLLNQSTNWDARLLALAATAAQQTTVTGLGQDVLYALYRAGLPTDSSRLAMASSAAVQKALAKAVKADIVALSDQQITAAVASFQTFVTKTRMTLIAPGAVSNFGDLLKATIPDATQQAAFADLYFSQPNAGATLWRQAAQLDIPAQTLDALKLQGRLLHLTRNSGPLTQKLQQDIGSLSNLPQLAYRGYHDSAAWKRDLTALVTSAGGQANVIPPAFMGTGVTDPVSAYAEDLARKVRLGFPTEAVAGMIDSQQLPVNQATAANVSAFLKAAALAGYQLGRTPLNAFLGTLPQGVPAPDPASTASVKTLHRLFQVTPSTESLKAALSLGFTSAQDIVSNTTRDEFIEKYAGSFPSLAEANLVYAKAQQVSSVTFNFFSMANQLDTSPPVYGMSGSASDRQNAKNAIVKLFPTMAGLFGNIDYCQCEDCLSVLSPAAYFVDLLEFLNQSAPNQATNTPLDVLIGKDNAVVGRRPDLAALPLTCENTNTAMPYIDLVNEILEYYIATPGLDANLAYNTGDATTADLIAEPQHVLPSAYDTLKKAVYPLNLPFDLWIETVRGFLKYFKIPLAQVLETMRLADTPELFTDPNSFPYYRAQILAEALGLSPAEYAVFTAVDHTKWFNLYGSGYANENAALADLKSAKTLSQRLGLTYQEVTDLVTTGFLNPALYSLILQFKRFGINLSDAFSYTAQPGYTPLGPQTMPTRTDFETFLGTITARYSQQVPSFDAKAWLNALLPTDYSQKVLVLVDPNAGCDFSATTLNYADGSAARPLDFLKLNLFVRLWKKLGWTLDETDRALQVLFPSNLPAWTDAGFDASFGNAWKTALVYLAHLDDLNTRLAPALGRTALLPFWTNLPVQGDSPLYAQLFLTSSELNNDAAFDDPNGQFPAPPTSALLSAHEPTIQGILGLTSDEIAAILADAGSMIDTATFTLANLSICYRYSALAKCLQLSVSDMIALKAMSGLDPFPSPTGTALAVLADDLLYNRTLAFVKQVAVVQSSGFTTEDLKYLLRHQFDPVGRYAPDPNALTTLVQAVAGGLRQIQAQNAVPADLPSRPESLIDQNLSALFPAAILKTLFALLTNAQTFTASQGNVATAVDPAPFAQETQLAFAYDVTTHIQSVSFRGLLLDWKKAQLEQINTSSLFAGLLDAVQKQAQAALAGSVGDILGVWASLAQYEAVQTGVAQAVALTGSPAATLAQADAALSLSFDQSDLRQWLGYRGVLTDAKKSALAAVSIPPAMAAVLSPLLDDVRKQAMPAYTQLLGRLLAMWTNAQTFVASQSPLLQANQVDPAAFSAAVAQAQQSGTISDPVPAIQLSYDPASQTQTLTCVGVLTDYMRGELAGLMPSSTVLANLLQAVRGQCAGLFQTLATNLLTVAPADLDNDVAPFLGIDGARQQKLAKATLVQVFRPLLAQKLARQLVVQTLSASLGADPGLTEPLVTDAALLSDPSNPGKSLLATFLAAGQQGVSAIYFASADLSGQPLATGTAVTADTADPTNPNANNAGTGSARFEGFLQVATTGPYRLFAELGNTGAAALLSVDSPDPKVLLDNPIIPASATAAKDHDEVSQFVQLEGGVPYHFTLDFSHVGANGASLLVQGETLAKGPLSQIVLYPQQAIAAFTRAEVLLAKVVQILQVTGIDVREISYLVANSAEFGNLSPSTLPTQPSNDSPTKAAALFAQFLVLADYADLRKGPAGGTDGLIDVFDDVGQAFGEAPSSQDANKNPRAPWVRLANLTRRDPQVVRDVAKYLRTSGDGTPPPMIQEQIVAGVRQVTATGDFANNRGVRRIWEALQLLQIVGIPASTLIAATAIASPAPKKPDVIATNFKNAVRARYTSDTWRPIAQSVFDPLRTKKRDALVAYLVDKLALEDSNQLFEYFLVDPGMEPVVQTSRLRLAISSVQTFIQRCLLNLENGNADHPERNVAPGAIKADWWVWMKRYRVWQANREIFLYPENWMQPELRLDKTDLFQTLEGALLQGDVTRDLVEGAFLDYLRGLDERARLDVRAMYLDQDRNDPLASTLHVIARTFFKPYKYFYRTWSDQSWSAWELVTPQIQGNHIVCVVWRGRLNLFWLTFTPSNQPPLDPKNPPPPQPQYLVQLNWSEYFQGKWGTALTFDTKTIDVATYYDVDATWLVYVTKEVDSNGNEGAVNITFYDPIGGQQVDPNYPNSVYSFRVTGRNCDPGLFPAGSSPPNMPPYVIVSVSQTTALSQYATFYTGSGNLEVKENVLDKQNKVIPANEPILQSLNSYALLPCANPVAPPFLDPEDHASQDAGKFVAPFFFADATDPNASDEHTFFVVPSLTETVVSGSTGWAIPPTSTTTNLLKLVDSLDLKAQVPIAGPISVSPSDPVASIYPMKSAVDWMTDSKSVVSYGNALIGQTGKMDAAVVHAGTLVAAGARTAARLGPSTATASTTPGGATS